MTSGVGGVTFSSVFSGALVEGPSTSCADYHTSNGGDGSNEEWQDAKKSALETHVDYAFLQIGTFVENDTGVGEERARLNPECQRCKGVPPHPQTFVRLPS